MLPVPICALLGCVAIGPATAAPRMLLSPLARATVSAPGELRGFWHYTDRAELEQMRQAGANFVGFSPMWLPAQERDEPHRVSHATARQFQGADRLRQEFAAPTAFSALGLSFLSSGGEVELSLERAGTTLASATLALPAGASRGYLDLPEETPPGDYAWSLSSRRGRNSIWVRPSRALPQARLRADGVPWPDVVADTWLRTPTGEAGLLADVGVPGLVPVGHGYALDLAATGMLGSLGLGTQNNAFFTRFPEWFWERYPDARMADGTGSPLRTADAPDAASWPGLDHPATVAPALDYLCDQLRDPSARIAYWVLSGECLYPTYLDPDRLTDYSPSALAHYRAYLARHRPELPPEPPTAWSRDLRTLSFLHFREAALAEWFAACAEATRGADATRPALVPVHGDIYGGAARRNLGMSPSAWAAVGEGWETGQIIQGDDPWKLNLRYGQVLGSFGLPIAAARLLQQVPDPAARLLQQVPDPAARGGFRGFTPKGLRRIVYEAVGMGAWHVGLVQWPRTAPEWDWDYALDDPGRAEAARVFAELQALEPELTGMSPVRPQLGVHLSDDTWLLEGWRGAWGDLHLGFARRQLPVSYLSDAQIAADDPSGYRAILCMDSAILPRPVATALEGYVRQGGTLLVGGRFAECDEGLRPHAPFPQAPTWSAEWTREAAGADHTTWRLGAGRLLWITNPDYRQFQPILFRLLTEAGLTPPVHVTALPDASMELEAFPLTDGLNALAVIINPAPAPLSARVDVAPDLFPSGACEARELLTGTALTLDGFSATVALPAHGVAVVEVCASVGAEEARSVAERVSIGASTLTAPGLETPLGAVVRARLDAQLEAGLWHKAAASAICLSRQCGVSLTPRVLPDRLELTARALAPGGGRLPAIRLQARLSPLEWRWWDFTPRGGGLFTLDLPRESLPGRYDPEGHHYEPWWGTARVVVRVLDGQLEGEVACDVELPRG